MKTIRRRHLHLLDQAREIHANPCPSNADLVFAARELVQATLPHSDPVSTPPAWSRTNGNYTLTIQPGYTVNPRTGEQVCIGYPYGSIPRLVLFWITTEALRTQNRRLWLGSRLNGFLREIGLNPATGGGPRSDARRLKNQLERLFAARISFDYSDARSRRFLNMHIAEAGELWWDPKEPDQIDLFDSWIDLGETFFRALIANPVPADLRALRALKQSPLALDLYTWLAYRAHRVNQSDRPVRVTWRQLQLQLGCSYSSVDNFRRHFKKELTKVQALYPQLHIQLVHGGVRLLPGPAIVPALTSAAAPPR